MPGAVFAAPRKRRHDRGKIVSAFTQAAASDDAHVQQEEAQYPFEGLDDERGDGFQALGASFQPVTKDPTKTIPAPYDLALAR